MVAYLIEIDWPILHEDMESKSGAHTAQEYTPNSRITKLINE
jgi:hypothetical protein